MRRAFMLASLLALSATAQAQVWATAVAKHRSDGTAIVYRYVKEFGHGFVRADQPDRILVVWRYTGEQGMPSAAEKARMDELEDALAPLQEAGFSTLALVSTGAQLREWTYYTRSEAAFFARLNLALGELPVFPIEIHGAPDPGWTTYDAFARGVTEKAGPKAGAKE